MVVNATTKFMDDKLLQALGLSPNEAKIYLSLVEKGESSVSQLAIAAGVHRRNAYDVIRRLIDKGLCFQIISQDDNKYNAVDPDKLTELLGERREELDSYLPALKKQFLHRFAPEEAYIYRGLEGQKNIWRDLLRVAKDSYFIGAKGMWNDPRLESALAAFFKEAKKKKIVFWGLYDHAVKSRMHFIKGFKVDTVHYRFLPKEYSTNSAIHIFGDYVVTHTGTEIGKVGDKTVFFVIHSAALAESYRVWFRYMWKESS